KRASRFIYLNKTCFNGLYRVNSKGEFNVPFGRYKSTKIFDPGNLADCSSALQGVDIRCCSSHRILLLARKADFVYFDPPYYPVDDDSFTSYTFSGFGPDMHQELAWMCRILDFRGVRFVLSNADTVRLRRFFKKFRIEPVNGSLPIYPKERGKMEV